MLKILTKLLFVLLLVGLGAPTAFAAIAWDTSSGHGATPTGASSISWSETCTSANEFVVVQFYTTATNANLDDITAATYGGAAMTQIDDFSYLVGASPNDRGWTYVLANPATGAQTVSATWATSKGRINGVSSCYSGVKQANAVDSKNNSSGTGATFTQSTTVVASNSWLVSGEINDSGTPTAGSGTTIRTPLENTTYLADSNGTVGVGSQSMVWNMGVGWNFMGGIVSLCDTTCAAPSVFKPLPAFFTTLFWGWW